MTKTLAHKMLRHAFLAAALTLSVFRSASAQNFERPSILSEYISTAVRQNPSFAAEQSRWNQTKAAVDQVYSNLYPKIDLTSRYTSYQGGRVLPGGIPVSQFAIVPYDHRVEAVWPIINYALWQGTGAAKAKLRAATNEVEAKKLALEYDVSSGYYNYAKSRELVTVRKNAVTLAAQNLATAQSLYKVEKAPKNDVLRAEVAVSSAQGDLLAAENMENISRTNFNNLLHRDYDAVIELPEKAIVDKLVDIPEDMASTEMTPAPVLPSFSSDYQAALAHRPEVEQIQNAEQAIEGLRGVSRAKYFPNVALFGGYGQQSSTLTFNTASDYLTGGVQLSWNLFNGFNTNAEVAENSAQIDELENQSLALKDGIRIELQNARVTLRNAEQRYKLARKQIASATENRRITKLQYDSGVAPLITLIDAETTLSNAEANLATSTYDVLDAQAKYRKALGIQ